MTLIRIFQWLLLVSLCTAATLVNAAPVASDDPLNSAAALLKSSSFKDKSKAVDLLSAHAGEQAGVVLEAFLDNRLYTAKADKRLVIADSRGEAYAVTDALTNEDLGRTAKNSLKIITLNNSLRRQIREALALSDLRHPDADRRLAAVNQLLDRPAAEHAKLLQPLLEQERDARVRDAMQIVTALGALTCAWSASTWPLLSAATVSGQPTASTTSLFLKRSLSSPPVAQYLRICGFSSTSFFFASASWSSVML